MENKEYCLYDSHIHTALCGHAVDKPAAYAWHACRRNLKGIVFTCHNPMPPHFTPSVRMSQDKLEYYVELIESVRWMFEGMLDIRLGLECDWLPEYDDYLKEQVASAPFDYVLGSVHANFPDYAETFLTGSPENDVRTYFQLLAECAESGLFDCLAHPDHIKYIYPAYWMSGYDMGPIKEALDRIKATGVAMEVNTSGYFKPVSEMIPAPSIVREIVKRDIPLVIGSDAHQPERVADEFEVTLDDLIQLGVSEVCHYVERHRESVPIRVARDSLI
jgi:histidinol-phosphatase (PHP family)